MVLVTLDMVIKVLENGVLGIISPASGIGRLRNVTWNYVLIRKKRLDGQVVIHLADVLG